MTVKDQLLDLSDKFDMYLVAQIDAGKIKSGNDLLNSSSYIGKLAQVGQKDKLSHYASFFKKAEIEGSLQKRKDLRKVGGDEKMGRAWKERLTTLI